MPSEFSLIERHFKRPTTHTLLGIGDDGALLQPSAGMELVVSTDMLVAGTHFFPDTDPRDLGWKVLAVNLSDLAAMGARPRWAFLAMALPAADEVWLNAFAAGLFECATQFDVDVSGGDTTRGSMNFCITIIGEVPDGQALLRSSARPGDEIWVSGQLGRAALGLAHLQQRCTLAAPMRSEYLAALHRPQPRVQLGLALRGIASAAIDVSDGLLADLGHILEESQCSAEINFGQLPQATLKQELDPAIATDCLLAGGDDYELIFTAPSQRHALVEEISSKLRLALTCVGMITGQKTAAITLLDAGGGPLPVARHGYDHFG